MYLFDGNGNAGIQFGLPILEIISAIIFRYKLHYDWLPFLYAY